jgi:hypothetical protein
MEGSCSEAVFALPASLNDQLSPSPMRTEESSEAAVCLELSHFGPAHGAFTPLLKESSCGWRGLV